MKDFVVYPVARAERLAKIMGPNSAPALALEDLKRLRNAGEDAVLLVNGLTILVGPRPSGWRKRADAVNSDQQNTGDTK